MKSWDVIIVGAGLIGLSLALRLRGQGLRVLVLERGQAGREASYAAAGMLVGSGPELPASLRPLADFSQRSYPEFVRELEDEAGMRLDLRDQGTILLGPHLDFPEGAEPLAAIELRALEPALEIRSRGAVRLRERSVDPRLLIAAAIKAAHHRAIDLSSANEAKGLLLTQDRVVGVQTAKSQYATETVINCAGAWAGCLPPYPLPVEPVKGQMLALVAAPALKHVVRTREVYLVPRSDGRLIIGSTLEHVGYNKEINPTTIGELLQRATELVPGIAAAREHEVWAGLRPGTRDGLPILGETSIAGYFVSSGHFRDGILLAPVTAQIMTALVLRQSLPFDLTAFDPARFSRQ